MAGVDTALRVSVARTKNRMTLAAKNKSTALHVTSSPSPSEPSLQAGWDPFEVWRTRVLLPRLAEAREEAKSSAPTAPVQLVRK
jgi:hypothetical protein